MTPLLISIKDNCAGFGINLYYYTSNLELLFCTGLEPAVFAALVPNSADKSLQELIEEIMGDHEMMVKIFPSFYVNFYVITSILPLVYLYFMQTANQSSST